MGRKPKEQTGEKSYTKIDGKTYMDTHGVIRKGRMATLSEDEWNEVYKVKAEVGMGGAGLGDFLLFLAREVANK